MPKLINESSFSFFLHTRTRLQRIVMSVCSVTVVGLLVWWLRYLPAKNRYQALEQELQLLSASNYELEKTVATMDKVDASNDQSEAISFDSNDEVISHLLACAQSSGCMLESLVPEPTVSDRWHLSLTTSFHKFYAFLETVSANATPVTYEQVEITRLDSPPQITVAMVLRITR